MLIHADIIFIESDKFRYVYENKNIQTGTSSMKKLSYKHNFLNYE